MNVGRERRNGEADRRSTHPVTIDRGLVISWSHFFGAIGVVVGITVWAFGEFRSLDRQLAAIRVETPSRAEFSELDRRVDDHAQRLTRVETETQNRRIP